MQVYFESITEGMAVPTLKKIATTRMLVQWAGASGDFNPVHYDNELARKNLLEGPIVHGALKRAWLGQLMTGWIGESGVLRNLKCQYRGIDFPRAMSSFTEPSDCETWLCKGFVLKKYCSNGQNLVDCEIWVENGKGQKTVIGTATIMLPSRDQHKS